MVVDSFFKMENFWWWIKYASVCKLGVCVFVLGDLCEMHKFFFVRKVCTFKKNIVPLWA